MPIAAAIAAEFDPDFYLAANPDVLKAGVDPLHHFVKHGWEEGRDPNGSFSVHVYLHLYPDVKEAGVNPFWHYVVAGRREGRTLERRRSLDLQVVLTSRPIRDREAATEDDGHVVSDATGLVERLSRRPLIVSVSHDDYTRSVGGIQNCINMEAQAAADAGIDYLHLYPRTNRSWLAPSGVRLVLGTTLNGDDTGSFETTDFLNAFAKAGPVGSRLVVHSLLGHNPAWISALSRLCTGNAPVFWTHDHTAICPSYTLQRNDVVSCGGPALDSRQCGLCTYGEERKGGHVDQISTLLGQIDPIVVSPSEFSRQFFSARVARRFSTAVVEHCVLTNRHKATVKDGAVRVAFVGTPAYHKGWSRFVDLVHRFGGSEDYEFMVFGPEKTELSDRIAHRAVSVIRQGRMAMVEALRRDDVDLVFLWPTWQETFCIVAYEAAAAGARILTNPGSGNVARLVATGDCGTVFNDFAEVLAGFGDGTILDLAAQRRREATFSDLQFSRMSLDVCQAKAAVA